MAIKESDLISLKKILLEREKQIEENIKGFENEFREISSDEMTDDMDLATAHTEYFIESSISKQQSNELQEIRLALQKINLNKFGICETCEDYIDLKRLRIKPQARHCIECLESSNKKQKGI